MTTPQRRARFVPDLDRRLSCCEYNYYRLSRLLPASFEVGQVLEKPMGHTQLQITFEEKTQYTTLIHLAQLYSSEQKWLQNIDMRVRLYHDVKLAEVVGFGCFQVPPQAHDAPTHTATDKQQLDDLLTEWLEICLQQE